MRIILPVMAAASLAMSAANADSLTQSPEQRPVTFAIERQDLRDALNAWAHQAGFQLISEVSGAYFSPDIQETLAPVAALERLLQGTPFTYEWLNDRIVAVRRQEITDAAPLQMNRAAQRPLNIAYLQDQPPSAAAQSRAAERRSEASAVNRRETVVPRTLETVLVTAQKREERLMDIPLSVAVISNVEIDRRGLIGMEDYLRSIPNVNQIDLGTNKNGIVIRGITTSPDGENVYSGTTVGVYFDETPITGAVGTAFAGPDIRPVDMERIEVLRGPQGTAYGSSSLGGTVRLIPARPQLDDFSARIAASYSSTSGNGGDNSMLQGILNVPLSSEVAVRAVGYRYVQSGSYRNVGGSDPTLATQAANAGLGDFLNGHAEDEVGEIVSTGGRLMALWQPTDKLGLSMNLLTQTIEQDGQPLATVGEYEQARMPIAPQGRLRGQVGEVIDTELDLLGNVVLKYDFGWAELTSVASWIEGGSTGAVFTSLPFVPSTTIPTGDFKSFSAETRLASQFAGPFQFLGGVYYEDVDTHTYQTVDWPGSTATNPVGTTPMASFDIKRRIDQRAVFGEVSYDLTDSLTATVGGRYYKYDKSERNLFEGGLVGVPIGGGTASLIESGDDDSIYRANLSYKPTADALLYASWAEGFRIGRPTAGLPSAACDRDSDGIVDGANVTIESTRRVDSDVLENYEVGGKFTLFDRRLALSAAFYHIDWSGLPVTQVAQACQFAYIANAGEATSDGVEFQANLFLLDGLRLDLGFGYTNAELSKDAPSLGAQEGARLPGSPEISASLGAQYDFDIAGQRAFVRADSMYTGDFYADLSETPRTKAGDYIKVDARAGVTIRNFRVELFVRNLTNEDALTWHSLVYRDSQYRLRPRTVGVELGYGFE